MNLSIVNHDFRYVRKTIATCIGKFWTNQPDYATERGLLDAARLMINDVNPMVVANAINTLKEIQECLGPLVLGFCFLCLLFIIDFRQRFASFGVWSRQQVKR
jgi:vesicle coat complex subunit